MMPATTSGFISPWVATTSPVAGLMAWIDMASSLCAMDRVGQRSARENSDVPQWRHASQSFDGCSNDQGERGRARCPWRAAVAARAVCRLAQRPAVPEARLADQPVDDARTVGA